VQSGFRQKHCLTCKEEEIVCMMPCKHAQIQTPFLLSLLYFLPLSWPLLFFLLYMPIVLIPNNNPPTQSLTFWQRSYSSTACRSRYSHPCCNDHFSN
jgi:hypothetical protein